MTYLIRMCYFFLPELGKLWTLEVSRVLCTGPPTEASPDSGEAGRDCQGWHRRGFARRSVAGRMVVARGLFHKVVTCTQVSCWTCGCSQGSLSQSGYALALYSRGQKFDFGRDVPFTSALFWKFQGIVTSAGC